MAEAPSVPSHGIVAGMTMTADLTAPDTLITAPELPDDDLDTPCAIVDLSRLERNIATEQARADAAGVALRPHAKTHKSARVAALQQAAGARGLTVGTLGEAEVFADAGFDDLFLAYTRLGIGVEGRSRPRPA